MHLLGSSEFKVQTGHGGCWNVWKMRGVGGYLVRQLWCGMGDGAACADFDVHLRTAGADAGVV